MQVCSLSWDDYLEEGTQRSSSLNLVKPMHGQRSLAGYNPWDGKESDTTEHTHARVHSHTDTHTHTHQFRRNRSRDQHCPCELPLGQACTALPVFHHKPLRTMVFPLNYVRGGQRFK